MSAGERARGVGVKRIVQGWEEQDAFTGWRKVMFWQRGELKRAKRRYHKKERRSGQREIREQDHGL
jgi:hypothetical protein